MGLHKLGSTNLARNEKELIKEGNLIIRFVKKKYPIPKEYSGFALYYWGYNQQQPTEKPILGIRYYEDEVEKMQDLFKFYEWLKELEQIDFNKGSKLYQWVEDEL